MAAFVHEHVETTQFAADASCRGGDGCLICDIELDRAGVSVDGRGGSLAALEIARSYQHRETMCHKVLCDLKTDSLICPGNQGDEFVLHAVLLCAAGPTS